MTKRKPFRPCTRPGCRRAAMLDGSGFCYGHNPNQFEKQKQVNLKIADTIRSTVPPPERTCAVAGCRKWAQKGSGGFCFQHNPAQIDKRHESSLKGLGTRKSGIRPAEKGCVVEGCRGYAVRESHYCIAHTQNQVGDSARKGFCSHPGCNKWAMRGESGLCF